MTRIVIILMILFTLAAGLVVVAQDDDDADTTVTPAVPQKPTSTPAPDDPRLNVCSAPTLDGFEPYIIRPGDTLAALLVGVPNISVTQLAALNCIDDPHALPIGAVIWIPEREISGEEGEAAEDAESNEPEIMRFEAESDSVHNQAGVVLSWQAAGETAYLYTCPADDDIDCARPFNAEPLPLNFTTEPISGFLYEGTVRYRLEVIGGDAAVTEDVTVDVTCSQDWLGQSTGAQPCPQEPPKAIFAAWQPFENGVMMWFSDTEQIWVMTNADNRVQVFDDLYMEGEPDPEAEAPQGLFTPVRGFGKVWEQLGGADSPLGWAMTPEIGFDSARQPASPRSYTVYVKGPDVIIYAVTIIPQIDVGYWVQIAQ